MVPGILPNLVQDLSGRCIHLDNLHSSLRDMRIQQQQQQQLLGEYLEYKQEYCLAESNISGAAFAVSLFVLRAPRFSFANLRFQLPC